jgi:hypothetical protein
VEAKVLECTAKARVSPGGILARHHKELLDLVRAIGCAAVRSPPLAPVVLRRDFLAIPAEDGLGRRERGDLGQQSSPERPSLFGKKPALRIGEPKAAWAEARPQHAILSPQELDCLALAPTDPTAEQQNEELERRRKRHGRGTIATRRAPARARSFRRDPNVGTLRVGHIGRRERIGGVLSFYERNAA